MRRSLFTTFVAVVGLQVAGQSVLFDAVWSVFADRAAVAAGAWWLWTALQVCLVSAWAAAAVRARERRSPAPVAPAAAVRARPAGRRPSFA